MIPSAVLFVKENYIGHETHIGFADARLLISFRPVKSIHLQFIRLHTINSLVVIKSACESDKAVFACLTHDIKQCETISISGVVHSRAVVGAL